MRAQESVNKKEQWATVKHLAFPQRTPQMTSAHYYTQLWLLFVLLSYSMLFLSFVLPALEGKVSVCACVFCVCAWYTGSLIWCWRKSRLCNLQDLYCRHANTILVVLQLSVVNMSSSPLWKNAPLVLISGFELTWFTNAFAKHEMQE